MLADARAQALVDGFAMQWLGLRRLQSVVPAPDLFPEFDDNLREAFEQETRALRPQPVARRPQRAGPAARRLHVRQRAAGAALRDPQRVRQPLSKVTFDDGVRGGLLGHGGILTVNLVSHAHVARAAGQLGAGAHPRRAAAAAAARRAGAAGSGRGRAPGLGARAAGAAPREPRVRELPRPHGPAGIRAGALRPHRQVARDQRAGTAIDASGSFRTGPDSTAWRASRPSC